MAIREGDKIPSVTLRYLTSEGVKAVPSSEFFAGKKVVLFALPGAFTPTCSAKHLPGFVEKAAEIKGKGVDAIACLSVNDAFVMGAWGKEHGADDRVVMIGDGSAEWTKAIGLDLDRTEAGMGIRSQRYAMVVDNGVVTALHVEPSGEYGVSSAETVLARL